MADPVSIAADAANRLTVRSALNPLLWVCGIVSVPCFVLAAVGHTDKQLMWALLVIGLLPVLTTCGIAIGFARYKPEKLQSDDYQLRQLFLQMLQVQGATISEVLSAQSILNVPNPAAPPELPAPPPNQPQGAVMAPAADLEGEA